MTRSDIMVLGEEIDEHDSRTGRQVGLPSPVWDRHLLITGETGAGKTTAATKAITTAHPHTGGPTIVIDPKGAGWFEDIARAQYRRTNSLEDVLWVDVSETLPALAVFDIRRDCMAGKPRTQATEDLADYFLALVEHAKPGGFQAVRSPDVIRYLIKALADPVHGDDAFSIEDLMTALDRMTTSKAIPEVSDDRLATQLAGLVSGNTNRTSNILDGARTRVEKFYNHQYLSPLFDHVPSEPADAFAFDDILGEDVLVLIDLGTPERRTQRILANLLLEELWQAFIRREHREHTRDPAQTLLVVDEVAHLRIDGVLERLLSMGREYGIGVMPLLQYPNQLETGGRSAANADTDAAAELLTNCHSILSGTVTDDAALATALSGSKLSTAEISNRLRNLRQDRWLFTPATPRDAPTVPTFMLHQGPLPPGHPDGPLPLFDRQKDAFPEACQACRNRTQRDHGIAFETDEPADRETPAQTVAATDDESSEQLFEDLQQSGFMTTLPLVDSLPGTAMYEPAANAIVCETCGANRPATFSGLRDTLACHGSLADIDRAAIPPVELGVTLTAEEIAAAPVSLRVLCGLQVMANMARRTYDPVEVDLVHDSPSDISRLLGLDSNDVHRLQEAGLITIDKLGGYAYYTVTPDGRDLLQDPHRKGVEWGHGASDNSETLLHIAMVEALRRYTETHHATRADSPITEVVPYFEVGEHVAADTIPLDGGTRFDVVGLDSEGRIRLIGEAERHNNDARTAAVADFDQIATVDPEHALWVVPSSATGHDAVLTPLADPPDGTPRIDGYSERTRIPSISGVDEPGMTEIVTLNELRKQLEPPALTD